MSVKQKEEVVMSVSEFTAMLLSIGFVIVACIVIAYSFGCDNTKTKYYAAIQSYAPPPTPTPIIPDEIKGNVDVRGNLITKFLMVDNYIKTGSITDKDGNTSAVIEISDDRGNVTQITGNGIKTYKTDKDTSGEFKAPNLDTD